MSVSSILTPQGLALRQNVIYRARMLVKAPKVVATESKVTAALQQQGFTEVQFFDRDKLPNDWPLEEHDDPSGIFSWTAFLQGRFTMTDRLITFGELPGTVQVLDMWDYLVPIVAAQPPPIVPGASAPPVVSFPVTVPGVRPELSGGQKVLGVAAGAFAAFLLLKIFSEQRSVWR